MSFSLYLDNGYVNIGGILGLRYPFNFIWGGRGTGKTYGALAHTLDEKITHMFSRTSQKQIDMLATPKLFPYKQINADRGTNIIIEKGSDGIPAFYRGILDEEKDKYIPDSDPIGYCCALSTIANMRGFDASDVKLWIYDEFVPEKNEKKVIKDVGYAFFNGYETMNRNREFKIGGKPLQVLCMSNSESVDCDLFVSLGLITKAADMCRKRQDRCFLPERGIALFNLWDSPISKQKSEGALYKMVGKDSDFYRMSIENDFYKLDYSDVKSENIQEYIPICKVGEICIYEHKSKDELYISPSVHGTPADTFGTDTRSLKAFTRQYIWVWEYYLSYQIKFETIESKILFDKYFHS